MSKLVHTTEDYSKDKYLVAVPTEQTAEYISERLKKDGMVAMLIKVDDYTMYNFMFVNFEKVHNPTGWSGGKGDLFLAIERVGAFCFAKKRDIHPNYLQEKLNFNFGTEGSKTICNLLNSIKL